MISVAMRVGEKGAVMIDILNRLVDDIEQRLGDDLDVAELATLVEFTTA